MKFLAHRHGDFRQGNDEDSLSFCQNLPTQPLGLLRPLRSTQEVYFIEKHKSILAGGGQKGVVRRKGKALDREPPEGDIGDFSGVTQTPKAEVPTRPIVTAGYGEQLARVCYGERKQTAPKLRKFVELFPTFCVPDDQRLLPVNCSTPSNEISALRRKTTKEICCLC